jgi:Fic family protein
MDSMKKSIIFLSSVQKEFHEEWRAIRDFVRGDALLRRFFDVFLFEDILGEYQILTGAIPKTAARDLEDLVAKGVLARIGRTGRGTHYVLSSKGTKTGQTGH